MTRHILATLDVHEPDVMCSMWTPDQGLPSLAVLWSSRNAELGDLLQTKSVHVSPSHACVRVGPSSVLEDHLLRLLVTGGDKYRGAADRTEETQQDLY